MTGINLLSINHLTVRYGKKIACKDISLTLKKGEKLGILGESGSGKSSLLKAIAGINQNFDGEIHRNFEHCGYVFQDPDSALNPAMKVGRLLKEPLLIAKNTKNSKEIIHAALAQIGLPIEYADRYPSKLSGGEKQRLSIAVALLNKPELFIADEPISALDKVTGERIMELFESLYNTFKFGFIFVSHNLRAIHSFCDKAIVMKDGYIIEAGNAKEIFLNPKHAYTRELVKLMGLTPGL